jgi:general secretion pathway protein B
VSYILDALRKAERERNLGQVPTLDGLPVDSTPVRRRFWPWILGVALIANAIIVALVFLYPRNEIPSPRSRTAPLPAAETAEAEQDLGVIPDPAVPAESTPVPTVPPAAPSPDPSTTVAPGSPEEEVLEAIAQDAAPPPEEEVIEAAPPEETISAPEDDQDVPWLRDMPPEFRRSLPEFRIDAHLYSDDESRRFVMINLRKYREGERLNEGPQLEAVLPDGVLLSWQGQRFRYPLPR